MPGVMVWARITVGHGPAYNDAIRDNGHDPTSNPLLDSMTQETWSLALPESVPNDGMINAWWMTEAEWAAMEPDLKAIPGGNHNQGNPGTNIATYTSREEEVAEGQPATKTKAPFGGWDDESVLGDDGIRSNEPAKVRSVAPD